MTLREGLTNWAALRAGASKPRTRDYHEETIQTILEKWPEKAMSTIDEISEADVAVFVRRIEHYSVSRFNGMLTALMGVLPTARNVKRRKVVIKDRPLISQLEFARLIDQLENRPRSDADLVVEFLAHTGLRINEARQLLWEHVREDYIFVPRSITKREPRTIPFVNGIREVLARLKEIAGDSPYVLPQAECKRALKTACRLAGLPSLSHQDFRHLFATRCIQSGVDLPTAARWLGHQDGGALLSKVYFHLVDEHSRRMAAKVVI